MATVNSVLGPLDSAELGFTLTHEHVVTASAGILQAYPELFGDFDRLTEQAAATLTEAREGGVRTIIDLTTLDLGRNILFLADLARRTGVNIIAATGIWRDIPRALWNRSPGEIAALFVREIEQGIEGTGIKAGIIKVANDAEGVTREGEVILRAAARAAKQTGVRISTHTYAPHRVGEQQVAIFEDEGLDLNRVYIGHSNDTTDLDYLQGLLRKGVWLGLDRHQTSAPIGPDWEGRAETLAALIKAGYVDPGATDTYSLTADGLEPTIAPPPPGPVPITFLAQDSAVAAGARLPFVRNASGGVGWVASGFRLRPRTDGV